MAGDDAKKKYEKVPGLKFSKEGYPIKPEDWSVVKWGAYLQDAEKYYNKKAEDWKPGKYIEQLKLKRKMKKTVKRGY